jgi:DNA-binding response OmpR family regulator
LATAETPLGDLARQHLLLEGYDVTSVRDGRRTLDMAAGTPFDVILLDVLLPTLDGLTICRALRVKGVNTRTPILMIMARGSESERVLGLESGADDYVTEPFSVRELMARVGALLRRSRGGAGRIAPRLVRSRDLMLDADRRHVLVRGRTVALTRQEFDLLYLLAGQPGIVFSRAAIMARACKGSPNATERTVDSVVSRLRRKIERNAEKPEVILTAWGVGYKCVDSE